MACNRVVVTARPSFRISFVHGSCVSVVLDDVGNAMRREIKDGKWKSVLRVMDLFECEINYACGPGLVHCYGTKHGVCTSLEINLVLNPLETEFYDKL